MQFVATEKVFHLETTFFYLHGFYLILNVKIDDVFLRACSSVFYYPHLLYSLISLRFSSRYTHVTWRKSQLKASNLNLLLDRKKKR